jgi:hypothetical protein
MNEPDPPCSDCGSTLVANHVPAHGLSTRFNTNVESFVADCPDSSARYYSDQIISMRQHLTSESNYPEGTN